jgi:hypothetical protein
MLPRKLPSNMSHDKISKHLQVRVHMYVWMHECMHCCMIPDPDCTMIGEQKRNLSEGSAGDEQRKWIISSGAVRMLQSYFSAAVPGPEICGPAMHGTHTISVEGHSVPFAWDSQDASRQDEASAVKLGMPYIFGHLSTANIITLVTALLLERKIIVQCEDIAILTAIVTALPWLIRPYKWQTSFIPLVPPSLYGFLSAPVPYIAGILTVPVGGYEEGVTVVQIESDQIWGAADLPRMALLDDIAVKLGPPHEHLSRPSTSCDFSRRLNPLDESTMREV